MESDVVQAVGQRSPATRLALSRAEAATALGVSVDFFDEHIAREVRSVRRGRRRLYPIRELERWLTDAATLALGHEGTRPSQP